MSPLGTGLLFVVQILWFALLAQVILSWLVSAGVRNDIVLRLYYALGAVLEPLMRPIRRVIPPIGMFDITPIVAFIILAIVRQVIFRVL